MKKTILIIIFLVFISSFASAQPANVPEARDDCTMITLPDGRVILFGGEDVGGHLFNDLHTFDGAWNEVTPSNDPPPGRKNHAACVIDGDVYINGGIGEDNILDDTWKYDIETNEWTQVIPSGDKPSARYGHTIVTVNEDSYLYGGKDDSGSDLTDFWSYDPAANEWQEDDDFHPPSSAHAIGVIGETIYAYGGIRWDEDDFRDDTRYYNTPLGSSWTYTYTSGESPGPLAFMFHAFMQNLANNCMYLYGGKNDDKALQNSFYKFNMETKTWYELPGGPPPLSNGAMAFSYNDTDTCLVLFGGLNSDGEPVDENWIYNFEDESWEVFTAIDDENNQIPLQAQLYNNFPNPFKNSTKISYSLKEKSHVNLSIYNVAGQYITTLVNEIQNRGRHETLWSLDNNTENSLPYGIYFYNLKINGTGNLTKKCFYFDAQ